MWGLGSSLEKKHLSLARIPNPAMDTNRVLSSTAVVKQYGQHSQNKYLLPHIDFGMRLNVNP